MSKSIKVSEETYISLYHLRRSGESFSDVIARLLKMNELLMKIEPIIEGERNYLEYRRRQLDVVGTDISGKPLIRGPGISAEP